MDSKRENDVTIEVDNLCKDFRIYKDKSHTFKDRVLFHKRNAYELNHVLKNVSFKVHRGEALGLIGHNGCGKSTTLKLLNKILYPDSGTIKMHGRISSLIELGAGFHPDMTGIENIYINASIFGLKKKEIDARLDDIIRFSELEEFINNPVRTYSSGMYMRLAFSIAINVDADILLVDEILAVGDANFQKKCFDKLEEIKNNGTTIVIVSHSMGQIQSICDNVIWLDEGSIKEEGEADKVCADYLEAMNERAHERHIKELTETNQLNEDPSYLYPPFKLSSQADPLSPRSGSMKVRYDRAVLKDMNGNPCTAFGMHPSFILDLDIVTEQPTKTAIVVNVFTKAGAHCLIVDSMWDYSNYIDISGHRKVRLTLKDLPLMPGDYLIDLALHGEDENYDNLPHVLGFSVHDKDAFKHSAVKIPDNLGIVKADYQFDINN